MSVMTAVNNNNNNNPKTMFMVLSSWQSHCKSSPGSFDKCRTAAKWLLTQDQARRLRLCYCVSLPVQAANRVYTHHRHLLVLLSPQTVHVTVPQSVEG